MPLNFAAVSKKICAGQYRAWSAIRLSGLRVLPLEARENPQIFHQDLLEGQKDVIHSLNDLQVDLTVELRHLFHPSRPFLVSTYFLVSTLEKAKAPAMERAQELGALFLDILGVNNRFHEFAPVQSKKDLTSLLNPFPVAGTAEIVRREDWIPLDAYPTRRPMRLGFCQGLEDRESPSQAHPVPRVYYVFPYDPPHGSLVRLFMSLLIQERPVFLSVCLRPCRLNEADERAMEERLALCEKYAQLEIGSSDSPETLNPYLRKQADLFHGCCMRDLFRLQDAAFLVRVQLAAAGPVPVDIIATTGATVTQPAGQSTPDHKEDQGQILAGGFDYMTPTDKTQARQALRNLQEMNYAPWVPSLSPAPLAHWRYLFDVGQAVSAFRLPFPVESEFPGVDTFQFQPRPAPANLPPDGLCIGAARMLSRQRRVYFARPDRRRHAYVVGKTGTGKSTLFQNMIIQDINENQGVGIIDPHGELIESILAAIPSTRLKDCILINPVDFDYPVGINLLDARKHLEKDFCVNYLIEVFDALYDLRETGGPMFEMYMRNALQLLLDQPEGFLPTVLDVPRLYQQREFRKSLLERTSNIYVRDFWEKEAERAGGDASLENISPYITSKLSRFIYNETMRGILGQRESTINFRGAMDQGAILLVDLRKGLLGDTNAHFLGMLIVGKLLTAALSRTEEKNKKGLRDFYLYVDEFQNLATPSFVSILSEARKYGLALNITNQYVAQLKEEIVHGILGNVGSIVSFRVGSEDAELLSAEFGRMVSPNDLMGLSKWTAYVRLLIDGNPSAPFTIQTFAADYPKDARMASRIEKHSRKTYGKPRALVEKEIREAWGLMEGTEEEEDEDHEEPTGLFPRLRMYEEKAKVTEQDVSED